MLMESSLLRLLVCPKHKGGLEEREGNLACLDGCAYPVAQGIPVLLRNHVERTLWVANASLEKAPELRNRLAADLFRLLRIACMRARSRVNFQGDARAGSVVGEASQSEEP